MAHVNREAAHAMHTRHWTDADFESMAWHDCYVHGFRVSRDAQGRGELELDLDYILEWRDVEGRFEHVIVPAHLRFHGVANFGLDIDWRTPGSPLGPFSLDGIYRRVETRERGGDVTAWEVQINYPSGAFEFDAAGFTQEAWGRDVVTSSQLLSPEQRVAV